MLITMQRQRMRLCEVFLCVAYFSTVNSTFGVELKEVSQGNLGYKEKLQWFFFLVGILFVINEITRLPASVAFIKLKLLVLPGIYFI